jgi:hypothetical protein
MRLTSNPETVPGQKSVSGKFEHSNQSLSILDGLGIDGPAMEIAGP